MKDVRTSLGDMWRLRLTSLGVYICLLGAAMLTRLLPGGGSADSMPQVVKGEGALAVAFGDARETISRAFIHKADGYFHGGIDMDCDHLGDHRHDDHCKDGCHDHDHDHDEAGHDHDHNHDHDEADHDHDHEAEHNEASHAFLDPWRWINAHVRAPSVHVHLEGKQSVEMMPWFWASVKADPHNIEAWTTTWYVANNSMKDKALALRVVNEGLEKNPDDPELLLCRGRTYYDRGHGDLAAAYAAFSAAFGAADRIVQRDGDKAPERIVWVRKFAKAYLDEMAKKGVLP